MKEFIKTYLVCLIVTEVFLCFGGYYLFDFSHHYYLAGASVAFLPAVFISVWMSQDKKIESLEKRIQELENKEKNL